MRFLQACASSQRAVGADAAVDDSTLLTVAGCEEQARALTAQLCRSLKPEVVHHQRVQCGAVFKVPSATPMAQHQRKARNQRPHGCMINLFFRPLLPFLCCVDLTHAPFAGLRVMVRSPMMQAMTRRGVRFASWWFCVAH